MTAFVDNLLNERHLNEAIPAAECGGGFRSPAERARYGVELNYMF